MPNFRLAIRTLARTPFVTLVAIISLALGIGANTAIFSLVQRVLLRPLPVPEPNRLVNILATGPNPGSQTCNEAGPCSVIFSYPMYRDLEKGQTGFAGIAGYRPVGADLAYKGRTSSGMGVVVSGQYFSVLGLKPALGRLFGPEDDRTVGGDRVAVLGHQYWTNELGADPSVVGQAIQVNGRPLTVVGVAPRGFEGTTLGIRARIFVPLTMRSEMELWGGPPDDRRKYWIYAFGRLKDGVAEEQALSQLNGLYSTIIADVELPLQQGLTPQTLADFKIKKIRLEPGQRGMSNLQGQTKAPLILLFAVTGIVLLVACTNVANLLLARAAARASEMAVRSSLGAGRGQLIGQLLAEAGLLALAAGVASVFVARGTLGLLMSFLPSEMVRSITFQLDTPVLVFAALVSLGTSVLFGLLPAVHSTRPDLLALTKSSGRGGAGRSTSRFRTWLVTTQIALSMALLCAAGLFIRSLANISRVELGMRPDSIVTFGVYPTLIGYPSSQAMSLFQRTEAELAALPGVTGVAGAMMPILRGWSSGTDVDVDGFPTTPGADVNSRLNRVGPDYFKALGIPVLAGREFTASDDRGAPKVVVVNEAFAKKFNLGANPIGKRFRLGNALAPETKGERRPDYGIVGLVRDAAYNDVKAEVQPVFYLAHRQDSLLPGLTFYVRTRGSTAELTKAIQPLMARLEPNLPVRDLGSLPEQIRENIFLERMISAFSGGFATLATLLAAVGLYGVLAYTVAQRTREIGLRMALGADGGKVRAMVLRQVGAMTVVGGVVGIAGAFAIGRAARSLLYQLPSHDLLAFSGAAIILTLVALGAGFAPAHRASRVHPMEALRAE